LFGRLNAGNDCERMENDWVNGRDHEHEMLVHLHLGKDCCCCRHHFYSRFQNLARKFYHCGELMRILEQDAMVAFVCGDLVELQNVEVFELCPGKDVLSYLCDGSFGHLYVLDQQVSKVLHIFASTLK
jgi:hypothetical protein